jgi:hypothetical protein
MRHSEELRKKASAGVHGVTYQKYEKDAAPKLETGTAKEDLQQAGFSSTWTDVR